MRKNLSREPGKEFVYNACQRFSFLTENISSRTLEWTQGHPRIYFLG